MGIECRFGTGEAGDDSSDRRRRCGCGIGSRAVPNLYFVGCVSSARWVALWTATNTQIRWRAVGTSLNRGSPRFYDESK
jgi:hypothetical protein